MAKYKVSIGFWSYVEYEIEADSRSEAQEKAMENANLNDCEKWYLDWCGTEKEND